MKKTIIFAISVLFLAFIISTSNAQFLTAITSTQTETTCNSCGDCSAKLDGSWDKVTLTSDINTVSGICITFNADNIIFDGGGYAIHGNPSSFGVGVFISGKAGNTIQNIRIEDYEQIDSIGIYLISSSTDNLIRDSTIKFNQKGVWLDTSANSNTIINNLIQSNIVGLKLDGVQNNLIYNNNFITNSLQASNTGTNSWDNGYWDGGNYWANSCTDVVNDYNGDPGSDGICDGPYTIDADTQDNYPFVNQDGWTLNRPPILIEPTPSTIIEPVIEGQIVQIHADAIDPNEGDVLDYSINDEKFNKQPTESVIFEWETEIGDADSSPYAFTVTVDDGNGGADSQNVEVTVLDNQAPTLNPIPTITVNEKDTAIVRLSATDDGNEPLTYSINSPAFKPYGSSSFYWITDENSAGTYTFTARVFDGEFTTEQPFTVTVKDTCVWDKSWFFRTGQWYKCYNYASTTEIAMY